MYGVLGMEDVAVIFGQPQLLVVDLPYGDEEAEFAQQGRGRPIILLHNSLWVNH